MDSTIGRAGAALSLANICYLRVWTELLVYKPANELLMKSPPSPTQLAGVMLNVLVGGALFWAAFELAWRARSGWLRFIGFSVLTGGFAVAANAVRTVIANHYLPYLRGPLIGLIGEKGLLLVLTGIVLLFVAIVFLTRSSLYQFAATVLLILLPFVPMTYLQAFWKMAHYDASRFHDLAPAPLISHEKEHNRRVVWIIYDEMDYRLTFVDRDPTVPMPEFDRIAKHALFATQAHTASRATKISLPSLLIGRKMKHAIEVGSDQLLLGPADGTPAADWRTFPDILARLRKFGFNAALGGWYLPYCRVLGDRVAACFWEPFPTQFSSIPKHDLIPCLTVQARSLFETSLLSLLGQSSVVNRAILNYEGLRRFALQAVANPSYDFVFLHLSIPHGPHFYDRKTGKFTRGNAPIHGYWDSLALSDVMLGEVRRAIRRAGLSERTALLISADHCYRSSRALDGKTDPRVPFLYLLPGQQKRVEYTRKFNTVVSQRLPLEFLRGRLRTPDDAVRLLEAAAEREYEPR